MDEKTGNAPIHSIVQRKKKDRVDLFLTLLINSDVEIDLQNSRDMTALHMAIEVSKTQSGPQPLHVSLNSLYQAGIRPSSIIFPSFLIRLDVNSVQELQLFLELTSISRGATNSLHLTLSSTMANSLASKPFSWTWEA